MDMQSVVSGVFPSVANLSISTCVCSVSSAVSAAVTSKSTSRSPQVSGIRHTVWNDWSWI